MFGLYESKKTGSNYCYGGLLCRSRGFSRQHVERYDDTGQQLIAFIVGFFSSARFARQSLILGYDKSSCLGGGKWYSGPDIRDGIKD